MGLTPEYINEFWTEELLALMITARNRYVERMRPKTKKDENGYRRLSNKEFFKRHNIKVTEVTGKLDLNATRSKSRN